MYGRRGGGAENGEENDEIDELATKLEKLDLTEEARKISQQELKKLKALGPRNQEYHVSMNYLTQMAELPWGITDTENLDPSVA